MNNLFNIQIQEKMPQIIDAFVQFYGEDYREYITKRLINLDIHLFAELDSVLSFQFTRKEKFLKELAKEYLKRIEIEPTNENIKKFFESSSTFDYTSIDYIYRYLENSFVNEAQKDMAEYHFTELLKKLGIEKGSIEEKNLTDKIIKQATFFKLLKEEENEYIARNQVIYDQIQRYKEQKKGLTRTANIEFLEEFKGLLTQHDKELLEQMKMGEEISMSKLNAYDVLISLSCVYKTYIDSFSSMEEETLKHGNDFQKSMVKKNRIEYFKKLGIDLGEDYELYARDELCRNLAPTPELVDRIIKKRKQLEIRIEEDCIKESPEFISINERLKEMNFAIPEKFLPSTMREGGTYVTNTYILENGEPKLKPQLFVCYTKLPDFSDVLFAHELNHVIDLHILDSDEENVYFLCGFDRLVSNKNELQDEETPISEQPKREFELFNEVINHLIAEDVTRIMHNNNIYPFGNEEKARIEGAASYSFGNLILRKFYETYRQEIIDSRLNGDMEILFATVGKENFMALNSKLNELFELNRYTLLLDLNEKRDSETVHKYLKIKKESEEIYEQMKNYNENMTLA